MANQDQQAKGFPGADFALPGLVLAIFTVYGYLFFKPDLESARPGMSDGAPPPPSAKSIPGVFSRLWQDPLAASYQAQKLEGSWWEKQLQRSNRDASRDARLKDMQDRLATIVPKGDKKLIVMPVLLPGGLYDYDKETRLRTRYAVLAGLHRQEYKLAYPERMSYIELPVIVHVPLKSTPPLQSTITVPIKLFTSEDNEEAPQVLVMWINEDQLGLRPLSSLAQIIDRAFPKAPPHRLGIRMIGPTDSDMLKAMAKEDAAYAQGVRSVTTELRGYWLNSRYFSTRYDEPKMYSPYATTSPSPDALPFINGNAPGFTGLQVVRTVGSDKDLMEALWDELNLRLGAIRNSDRILLIAERDSDYGQSFAGLYQTRYLNKFFDEEHKQWVAVERRDMPEIRTYSFLRGFDGRLPSADGDGLADRDNQTDGRSEKRAVEEGATGRSQLDYLRRLERDIMDELGNEQKMQKPVRVVAVGILGTDVYDKLLILRAFRKNYPGACFFTTDLDARLLDKQEYPYARNLIVASHFGLQLHPDHQVDISPFRDGYQTACFLAVRLALNDVFELPRSLDRRRQGKARLDSPLLDLLRTDPWGLADDQKDEGSPYLKPLVFEVAREGAFQLTITGQKTGITAALQPRSSREQAWVRWDFVAPAVALLATCLCLQVTRFRQVTLYVLGSFLRLRPVACFRTLRSPAEAPEAKWRLLRGMARDFLFAAAAVFTFWLIGAITWDHRRDPDGEPFLLAAGISVWPATLLRYAALIVGAGLLHYSYLDLRRSEEQLRSHYRLGDAEPAPRLRERDWWKFDWWGDLLLPRAKLCESNGSGKDLWDEYTRRGHWMRRGIRVLSMTVCYVAFALLLFGATDFPNLPHRGGFSTRVPFWILCGAVPATLALSFFVLDAVQLCGRFVKDLSQRTMTWPGADSTEHLGDAIQERITIEVIADRTQAVGKLLQYPFAMWLLLIGSRLFDYMPFTWPLVVVIGLVLLGVSASYMGLKRTAERARRRVLERLNVTLLATYNVRNLDLAAANTKDRAQDEQSRVEDELDANGVDESRQEVSSLYQESDAKTIREMIREVITQIREQSEGAFRPLTRDLLFQALALPFGGVGALLILEQWLSV